MPRHGGRFGLCGETIAAGIFNPTTGALVAGYGLSALALGVALQQWTIVFPAGTAPPLADIEVEAFIESAAGATARRFVYDIAANAMRINAVDYAGALANVDAAVNLRVVVSRVRVPGAQ